MRAKEPRFKILRSADIDRMEMPRAIVKIKDGHIVFPDFDYWIPLNYVNSHEKLVGMVHHLLEKNWVSSWLIRRFLEKATHHHKLKLYV